MVWRRIFVLKYQFYCKVFRDAWKGVEGMQADAAKEKYIEILLEMFDNVDPNISISEWLNDPNLDPSIKTNLALLGKDV